MSFSEIEHKIFLCLALGGQALFLNLIGYCGCGQEVLIILFLIIGIGISGFQYSGFVVNYLDICPAHAGTVVGIGNTLSCLAGILSPICMGWLTPTVGAFLVQQCCVIIMHF